ncbi:MAG TPA: hypothetical protein VII68_10550 [Casimicrobiaceae bacterium]|jgi:hypothetical protein
MNAPRVFIATLGIDYPAPARLPFELKQAGCEVAVFAPAGSLAAHTPHVDHRAIAAGRATTGAWTELLLREIVAYVPSPFGFSCKYVDVDPARRAVAGNAR